MPQGPRAKLHATLYPTDHLPFDQGLDNALLENLWSQPLPDGIPSLQTRLHRLWGFFRTEKAPTHGIGSGRSPWSSHAAAFQRPMPGSQRRTQGGPGVASGGLNPKIFERPLPQQPTVGHTIKRHPSGEAEVTGPGLFLSATGQPQHRLLGHPLDRSSQVEMALFQSIFRPSR